MKLASFIAALMGADDQLDIPLPKISTTAQAEQTLTLTREACPLFDFTLEIRAGRWWLIAMRRAVKVSCDA